jgi:transcriptional regulator with GAF, ATPase, and Fis domain
MQVNQSSTRIDEILSKGTSELSMILGVLARIENNNYEIVAVQSNSGAYVPGEKYALGRSYCREVFEQQQTIAITSSDETPLSLHHPLYRSLPLECFIGAPIVVDGKPWGCVDFSSMANRDEPFDAADLERINAVAAEIAELFTNR